MKELQSKSNWEGEVEAPLEGMELTGGWGGREELGWKRRGYSVGKVVVEQRVGGAGCGASRASQRLRGARDG